MKCNWNLRWVICACVFAAATAQAAERAEILDKANPLKPLPKIPLGLTTKWEQLENPPKPETVRLGRWLYFDKRLSADGTISCATCHIPKHGFSEPTPVSTGIRGQKGGRKSPSFLNQAWTLYPHFFWDGRAASLEEQAVGPMANPIEMGNTHPMVLKTMAGIKEYGPFFKQAFGDEKVTLDRIAKAIADYERTRISGNSAYDRWNESRWEDDYKPGPKDDLIAKGFKLFHEKAECNQCHLGQSFTDSQFHNLGVGWDAEKKVFKDWGRYDVTGKDEDRGAFKTPGLRDVSKRAPYMHDGSMKTLRETVVHYNKGGNPNPWLSKKIRPLNLTDEEMDAIVVFMEALDGEGYMDAAPAVFPR